MNFETQYYNNIPLRLVDRNYKPYKAKRFLINNTKQNVWIPNVYLEEDGTIKSHVCLDFIFKTTIAKKKLRLAGINYE